MSFCSFIVNYSSMAVFTPSNVYSSRKLLTLFKHILRFEICKMNHVSLFFKSCLVLFLTHIMALRFYAAPPQILGFFGTVLGNFSSCICESPEYKLQWQCSIVNNYLKQACICLSNYYENVWTVSKRALQNVSAFNFILRTVVHHTFSFGKELRFSRIWQASVRCISWQ